MRAAFVAAMSFVSWSAAQQPAAPPVELPVLLRLGTVPENAPEVAVTGDGSAALAVIPPRARELAVRADKAVPAAALQRVLADAREHGCERVFLLATLPDGTRGALALALPAAADVPVTATLRAHRGRPGVPPESAVPLLRRLREGCDGAGRGDSFVLALDVPADATCAQLLHLLAAAVDGNVPGVVVRTHGPAPTPSAPAPAGALALDLEASFVVHVPARERVSAAPGLHGGVLGATVAAPRDSGAQPRARTFGRYGGRGGTKTETPATLAALQRAVDWLLRQQRPDGSFANAHGLGDVEGTALLALVLLGRGNTLDTGPQHEALARAVGWLLGHQRDDGCFDDPGPGSLRAHATATWALSEATGLSPRRELVQAFARAALDWLFARRGADGGWNGGAPNAGSDAASTTHALTAAESARFFALEPRATAQELVDWFERNPQREPRAAAAELFARYFAGQAPASVPGMAALADTIAAGADPNEPEACYLATFALFQHGGVPWQRWSERVGADLLPLQHATGELAGSWPAAAGTTAVAATARFALALTSLLRYSRMVTR